MNILILLKDIYSEFLKTVLHLVFAIGYFLFLLTDFNHFSPLQLGITRAHIWNKLYRRTSTMLP